MKKITFLLFCLLFAMNISAQKNEPAEPNFYGTTSSMRIAPSLASRTVLNPAVPLDKEPQDGRSSKNKIVIGKDPQTKNDQLASNPHALHQKIPGRAPINVFDVNNTVGPPSDPAIGIGPDHAVIVYNTGFIIYDKSGNDLTGPLNVNNIFSAGGCCDLTISYDSAADRWVMSYLFVGAGAEIAVSDGPNPITSNWYVYSIPQINDYQKLSVWSDGYYMTDNTNATNQVYAMERDQMLAGNPSAQIIGFPLTGITTSGFFSPQAFNVSNSDMPAAGGAPIVYLQDDAWAGVSQDHIKLWTIDVDWVTPGNSQISAAQTINTTPFISVFDGGSFSNLTQPNGGGDIDALQATIMNQAQFRKFAGHNSAVFNFVVDTDATAGELAGIRWFELRQSGDNMPWTLYQEGTYTAPDGRHAWHASMIMDSLGNIGMGYTSMSGPTTPTDVYVSSYYTGRFASDPLNTMTIAEEVISNGNGNVGGFRYGDYSKIDVDPNDDKTFWFINEYINNGGKDVVGVFKIAPDFNNDVGVVNIDSPTSGTLGNAESVTVTIFNFGLDSQSNIPVTLTVDGNVIANEVFPGPLASATSAQYTFTQTVDMSTVGQTYTITASTNLGTDEDTSNDPFTAQVTHLNPDDIGVSAIVSPVSGIGLTATETLTVTITNYGGATQTNFDVTFDINGTSVTETVPGPLNGNSSIDYTFMATGDFSVPGSYNVTAYTALPGDSDTSNDSITVAIVHSVCQPSADCSFGDGFQLFQVGTINNTSGCEGYADFTAMSTDLDVDSTNSLTVTTGWGSQFVRVWIDFNDDYNFTNDEIVVNNIEIASGSGSGTHTETMDLVIPANAALGMHLMRAKTNWDAGVPDDACQETTYGETEDYTVNIVDNTNSTDDQLFNDSDFVVSTLPNDQFNISVTTTEITERLTFSVTNLVGQKLLSYNVENVNGGYEYDLDMSYATPGVYIIRLGNSKLGNSKKIIVK